MPASIAVMLSGGNPRTLGRAEQVVTRVLARPRLLDELFECVFNEDEIVRMRAGDALEKVCRQKPHLFQDLIPRLLTEVSSIDQPSVQWHLAQMLGEIALEPRDRAAAIRLMKRNLNGSTDWIVISCTMDTLAKFARQDYRVRQYFIPRLRELSQSPYKSISSRAKKLLAVLGQ